jgi:hypothetical protein
MVPVEPACAKAIGVQQNMPIARNVAMAKHGWRRFTNDLLLACE